MTQTSRSLIPFASIRAAVFDMDGVLWRAATLLPGVAEFFAFLQQHDIQIAFATNNSTSTVEAYVKKLSGYGIPAEPHQIITSAVATANYMHHHYPAATPLYIIGETGIRQALAEYGFVVDPDQAQVVIVGMDRELTYAKMQVATLLIGRGAAFIGTNGDRSFPIPEGIAPGSGSILAAIEAATDVAPIVIGKPETAMFDVALERIGVTPEQAVMIGDRLETDILGAQRAGLYTALMLTGVTSPELAASSEIQANGVFAALPDLLVAWEAAL
ncbi:MAG: HAD-IIA family hydrolase [Anaerolineae bacterium]|nr:HAD-IIA family hydrolase [Anaerolineae bacterium]